MKRKPGRSRNHGVGQEPPRRVLKLCGGDVELGNFILGRDSVGGTAGEAARALLREIDGLPRKGLGARDCHCETCEARRRARSTAASSGWYSGGWWNQSDDSSSNSQDWGRKFLTNGSCCYTDLDHFELALPEVTNGYDHVACWHAMLRIASDALVAANGRLPEGQKIIALANNVDGHGHSHGAHLNFLVTRRAWDNIFSRRLHYLLYLAAYQVSSIVFTGQGKVGSDNGLPEVSYQISQRADFFEVLTGIQTTYNRPIVNSRDEALCGDWRTRTDPQSAANRLARLHVIFYDNTLCHVACLLKVGVLQIILAMIEAEQMNPALILEDPVAGVVQWSHDPTLSQRSRLAAGQMVTAVELQMLFLEEAQRFVEAGGCEGVVPHAKEIVALWADTLTKLQQGDFDSLAPRLDWVLKLSILQRALEQRPGLNWDSDEIKHLDHWYSALDDGLYWVYERAGQVQRLVSDAQIERYAHQAPEDTRAWTRAMLLRVAEPDAVDDVDWDRIRFRLDGAGGWPQYRTVDLAAPLLHRKADTEAIFRSAETFNEILDRLGAPAHDTPWYSGETFAGASPVATTSPSSDPTVSATPVDPSRLLGCGDDGPTEGGDDHHERTSTTA